jgi:hypothetical protein
MPEMRQGKRIHLGAIAAAMWLPFATRLRNELDALATLSDELLAASTIEDHRDSHHRGGLVFVEPDWGWGSPTDDLRRLQIALIPRYDLWLERCRLIFMDAPEELREKLENKTSEIREWIARDGRAGGWGTGWDVPPNVEEAKGKLAGWWSETRALLAIVAPDSAGQRVIALPDTSALIDAFDFERYPAALGVAALDIFLVSAVLSELDTLKDQGRTPEVREKARAAGRAIKTIRGRGSLLQGVVLSPTVRVFSRPQEPDFSSLPGSLDRSVPDDRVLAAAFELQRHHATAAVILVTSDLNLQTKAELAQLPFAEPP